MPGIGSGIREIAVKISEILRKQTEVLLSKTKACVLSVKDSNAKMDCGRGRIVVPGTWSYGRGLCVV